MTTKINTVYASTIIFDYIFIASFLLIFAAVAADTSDSDPAKKALCAGLCMFYMPIMYTVREQFYWIMHKGSFSEFKTKWKLMDQNRFFRDIIITVSLVVSGVSFLAYKGFVDCYLFNRDGGMIKSLLIMSRDYWMINLIKDNICMRYVHPWMHKRENYWLHKHHHKGRRDCNVMHAFVFDTFDLFVEFLVGSIFALMANKLLFGSVSVHLVSLMYCVWTDSNVHSENPYSQCIGNPILDYFFKLNICHNLHHASESESKYMVVYPYHHWNSVEREKDVEKYNKVMRTAIDFKFILD